MKVSDISNTDPIPVALAEGEKFANHETSLESMANVHPSGGSLPGPAYASLPKAWKPGADAPIGTHPAPLSGEFARERNVGAVLDNLPQDIAPSKLAADAQGGMYGSPWGNPNKT